jgi:hypothetical protein
MPEPNFGLLLVPASVVAGLIAGRAVTSARRQQPPPAITPTKAFDGRDIDPMEQQQREQLRTQHHLRPVGGQEEGAPVHSLPAGVYGFSYAPATETPLFARKSYHSFEVHKRGDGSAHMLAFVTKSEAERLAEHGDDLEVTVYPDPYGESDTLVTVPFERILTSLYKPVRRDGNAVPLTIARA